MQTMKAVVIRRYGDREVIDLSVVPVPQPGPGEVLVQIKAAGVNPVDWKIRAGRLEKRMPHQFPITLGWDMAGVIVHRGLGARRFELKDEVWAYVRKDIIRDGTYAEYIVVPESYLSLKPKKLDFLQAAAVPLAALTAYQGLFVRAQIKKGETCLIQGASGGVGSFALQMAKLAGAKVIAVGSKKNLEYLKGLGAYRCIDYKNADVEAQLRKICPKGADVVFDMVGGDVLLTSYRCVRRGGRVVTIVEPGDEAAALKGKFKLMYHFVEPHAPQLDHLAKLFDTKKLRVHISKTFPLHEAALAHAQLETGHTRGKVVLKIAV